MSVNIVNKTTGELTKVAGNADDAKVGNLNALTTTDKSSAVGAINEVKSGLTNLSKANGGDAVDITDRVGSSNAYIVPADGYITLDTGASSSGGIDIRITGANGYGLAYIIISAVTTQVVQSVYVRKDMQVFISSNTTGSSTVKFRPFT